MSLRRFLAEPMLHFAVIGIVLFTAYRVRTPGDARPREIVVTQGVVDDLVTQHAAARGRRPSAAELRNLIEAWVREEIVYREGTALGLDRDDIVVKRRVRQKLEVMVEEEAATTTPTDADLSAYMAAHPDRFRTPAVITFEQAFLGPMTTRQAVERIATTKGHSSSRAIDPMTLARPTLLPQRMTQTESDIIARSFGTEFATRLEQAPTGEWTGPIESAYGAHYVRVFERTSSVMPQLADVRAQVVREWENERRQRARDDSYAKLRRQYAVSIDATLPEERR